MRLAEWTAPARARVSTTKYVVLIGSQLRAGRPITRRGSRSRKIKTSKRRRERERRKKTKPKRDCWLVSFFFKHQRGNQSAHGRNCGPHQIIDGFLLINDGHGSNGRLNEFFFSPFLLFTVFASDRKKWNHQKKQQEIRPQNKRPSLLLLLLLFLLLFLLFFYGFLLLLPTKN